MNNLFIDLKLLTFKHKLEKVCSKKLGNETLTLFA